MRKTAQMIMLLIVLIAFCGCNESETYKQLVEVDTLLLHDKTDSALIKIQKIGKRHARLTNEEIAYYNLLLTQTRYRLYLPIVSDSLINVSVAYYRHEGGEKLARSYYYQGAVLYNLGIIKASIYYLKKAENIAQEEDNKVLENKIYTRLRVINNYADEFTMALYYARKNLVLCLKNGNNDMLAYAYNDLAVAHGCMGNLDSSVYYIKKVIPLLKYIPKNEGMILDNLGYLLMSEDVNQAEKYLEMAYRIGPSTATYSNLAKVYIIKGNKSQAEKMWKEALKTDNIKEKSEVIAEMIEHYNQKGDYKESGKLSQQLLVLKDSVQKENTRQNVKDMQYNFDQQMKTQQQETRQTFLYCTLAILLLIVVLLLFLYKYRSAILKNKLMKKQIEVEKNNKMIRHLEESKTADKNEIQKYKRFVDDTYQQQLENLKKGHLLYEEMTAHQVEKMSLHKSDYINILDYYATIDARFSLSLNLDYAGLSPKYKVFMILQHVGKSDEEIMTLFEIGRSALRSIMSRIKQYK